MRVITNYTDFVHFPNKYLRKNLLHVVSDSGNVLSAFSALGICSVCVLIAPGVIKAQSQLTNRNQLPHKIPTQRINYYNKDAMITVVIIMNMMVIMMMRMTMVTAVITMMMMTKHKA